MRKFPRPSRCYGAADPMKLDPAAEALIGTHTISAALARILRPARLSRLPTSRLL